MAQAEFDSGSEAERDSLIVDHISYANRLSKRFFYQRPELGIEREEFQSAAYLGLCDAAQRFDRERGLTFETFSYLRIRGAMYDLLRRGGWSGAFVPESQDENEAEVVEVESPEPEFAPNELRPRIISNSLAELASLINSSEGLNVRMHGTSWEPETESVELSYSEQIDPESYAIMCSTRRFLRRIMQELPQMEHDLIELYYFQSRTLEDIREHFNGASKSWLSRVHNRALDHLRLLVRNQCVAPVRQ